MNSLPFSAIMPQANLEAAAIATVSFTGDIIEEAFARVEGADSAPSVGEAEASEAAPIGDLVNRTQRPPSPRRQKQPKRLKKTDWPRKQLRQMRRRRPKRTVAREAAELACKTEKERQARNAAAEQPGGQEQRLALEAAQKAEEEHLNVLSFSARTSQSSKTAAALATVIITEAALEKRLLGSKEMMAHQLPLRLLHQSSTHG